MISGANRGIGAAAAKAFAEAGWNVSLGMRASVMPDWGNPETAQVHAYDALVPSSPHLWATAARERFGRIDAVVANAGVMIRKTVVEANDEEFAHLMEVIVNGLRRLVKACWDQLIACGSGRVVIVASLSGKRVKSAISGSYSVSNLRRSVSLTPFVRRASTRACVQRPCAPALSPPTWVCRSPAPGRML